jgi:hypothetical protein
VNLSVIERMIRDGDMSTDALRYLLSCRSECEWLDYKEIIHLDLDAELCDFAKDVLALKNVGGGYVVIGVKDKTWNSVGLQSRLPYDTKILRDKIRRATGIDLDVDIVHHNIQTPSSTGLFALIFVRSSRKRKKRRVPTLATKDFAVESLLAFAGEKSMFDAVTQRPKFNQSKSLRIYSIISKIRPIMMQ